MKTKYYSLYLASVCVFVFILQLIPGFTDMFVLNSDSFMQLWRFFTALFLHGSIMHLLYNMFALVFFGLILENFIGSRKFLLIFFSAGVFANLIAVNFYSSSLGASGAIFGIIGALIVIRPMLTVFAFGLPMPMLIAGLLWAAGDILGAYGFLSGNPINNTGNIAHLAGMFFGIVLGFVFKPKRTFIPRENKLAFDENSIRAWEDSYLR